jgi:3-hydroxyisobutyrate dehydrogenase
VHVWDTMRARADALIPFGAQTAPTAALAAARASTVITLLRDEDCVSEALIGPDGAVTQMHPGTLWLQLTRVDAQHADAFAALARTYGLAYVDTQLAGDWEAAERGHLVLLAAGTGSARVRSQPVFDAIGRQTRWVESAETVNGIPWPDLESPPNGGFLRSHA